MVKTSSKRGRTEGGLRKEAEVWEQMQAHTTGQELLNWLGNYCRQVIASPGLLTFLICKMDMMENLPDCSSFKDQMAGFPRAALSPAGFGHPRKEESSSRITGLSAFSGLE